jgi:hypothetical protein
MRTVSALLIGVFLSVILAIGCTYAATAPELTRSDSGGGVTVKVTHLKNTSDDLRFSVALDTHSVNLDGYDLKALSFMRDDTGAVMQPSRVDNKGSGHHREVVLVFPRASASWNWLEVIIKDVAGVKERTFRWERK